MIAGVAPETCREVVMTLGVKKLSHEKLSLDALYIACMLGYIYLHYVCVRARALLLVLAISLGFVHMYF